MRRSERKRLFQLKYKKRVYKMMKLDEKQLKQLHSKVCRSLFCLRFVGGATVDVKNQFTQRSECEVFC
jgi:hypothetical protein